MSYIILLLAGHSCVFLVRACVRLCAHILSKKMYTVYLYKCTNVYTRLLDMAIKKRFSRICAIY
jgi:hypothetical protein